MIRLFRSFTSFEKPGFVHFDAPLSIFNCTEQRGHMHWQLSFQQITKHKVFNGCEVFLFKICQIHYLAFHFIVFSLTWCTSVSHMFESLHFGFFWHRETYGRFVCQVMLYFIICLKLSCSRILEMDFRLKLIRYIFLKQIKKELPGWVITFFFPLTFLQPVGSPPSGQCTTACTLCSAFKNKRSKNPFLLNS